MFSAINPFQEILGSKNFRVFSQFDDVAINLYIDH